MREAVLRALLAIKAVSASCWASRSFTQTKLESHRPLRDDTEGYSAAGASRLQA